jgi:selenocysteine-specific elongation factor
MRSITIGTAGHIDHGKTSLVKAITGIDTDTLKEEQERGITIDIGFAHWSNGITFIDVPGHERFIRNMVAGVNAIDFALLVIAADDGIMPQTREHLDILRWLGIGHGAVVITKTDLASEERIGRLMSDIEELIRSTFLYQSRIFTVSVKTGNNIDLLKAELQSLPERLPIPVNRQSFRMYIDRVFGKSGFGNIVTGTVLSGEVRIGDTLTVCPDMETCRVRSIQKRHAPAESASTGERTALNVSGIETTLLGRGSVLIAANHFEVRSSFIAQVHFGKNVKPYSALRLMIGTAELFARVSPVARLSWPDSEGYIRIRVNQPLPLTAGDRFILREKNASGTIGGGTIAWFDHDAVETRSTTEQTELFDVASSLNYEKIIQWFFRINGYIDVPLIVRILGIEPRSFESMIFQSQFNTKPAGQYIFLKSSLDQFKKEFVEQLKRFHTEHPSLTSIRFIDFHVKFFHQIDFAMMNTCLDELRAEGIVVQNQQDIKLAGHQIRLDEKDSHALEQVERLLISGQLQPPGVSEVAAQLNITEKECLRRLHKLISLNKVIKADSKIYFHSLEMERANHLLIDFLKKNKHISFQDFKQQTGISRKYVMALLEYFDQTGLTTRTGEVRILNPDYQH